MNIYKLINWQKGHSVSVPSKPDVQTKPAETIPWDSGVVGDVKFDALLSATGRSKNHTRGDGHCNCGFNATLEQVGDKTHTREMVNLLRNKLGYGDEDSNEMFNRSSCLAVSGLFEHPVVEIYHDGGKITELSVHMLSVNLCLAIKAQELLSQNFAAWCVSRGWEQNDIDVLSSWFQTDFPPFDFGNATLGDVFLQLLRCPTTIAFVSASGGGHFDAAPHKDLKSTGNVSEFLRKAKSYSPVKV
ncbi:MAG: hypothetical protein LBF49_01545 [Puniceicoccales bacterium]|jgi:hypothetical protein|nr:hypothetical protein [Puniceicoccales bacterium]